MKRLIYFLCVTLSFTSISFFKIGMAEFTLFHALVLITLFFISFIALKKKEISVKAPPFLLVAICFLTAVNLYYFDSIKTTSFLFSLIIMSEIVLLYNLVKRFTIEEINRIMKIILLVYFINIVTATFFIVFNYTPKGLLAEIFQIYNFDHRIRPYGFSDEPSYASLILIFTLFVLFKSHNFSYNKKEFKWYFVAVMSILLTGSSYGYLLLAILLGYFILKSKVFFIQLSAILNSKIFTNKQFIATLFIGIITVTILFNRINFSENKSVQRLISLYLSITSSEEEAVGTIKNIAYVDGSASMRLVPSILLIEDLKKSSWSIALFGRGAGQSIPFFSKIYEGNTTVLGFIPSFIYNYGIVGALIFLLFFYFLFPKEKKLLLILFTLFIFNADFNTQIFVYVLFTIMLSKQIEFEKSKLSFHE